MPKQRDNDKKQPKYGKKSSFDREKHYVCSEEDISRIDNKLNEQKEKRREERDRNLKIASGIDPNEEQKEKPKEKTKEKTKDKNNGDYADDRIISDEEEDEPKRYFQKMNLIVHGLPLSYNLDNVMRYFQHYGDIDKMHSIANIDSTYTITIVPNSWCELIVEIQSDIAKNGFSLYDNKYKITADDTQPMKHYGVKI
jgi:hypothetical protein